MLWRGDEDQFIFTPDPVRQVAMRYGALDNADLDAVGEQTLLSVLGVRYIEKQLDVRIFDAILS